MQFPRLSFSACRCFANIFVTNRKLEQYMYNISTILISELANSNIDCDGDLPCRSFNCIGQG